MPAGFLEYLPYKVSKIGYGLFSYALQPAIRTIVSFMGAILEEYLVKSSNPLTKNKSVWPVLMMVMKRSLERLGVSQCHRLSQSSVSARD